ncbi:MAG: ABC transporter permease [Bacillota bacterium]|nr:ABC transporter permease [Bacillota bacterium]
MKRPEIGRSFVVASFLVYAFLMFPMLVILMSSFDPKEYMSFPPTGFSLRWYAHVFDVELFMVGLKTSVSVALLSTLVALILGVPAAYLLVRFNFRGKAVLQSFFLSPLVVPGIVLGCALLRFFVIVGGIPIYPGLVLGHTILVIPYAVRVTTASLVNLPVSVEEAALSLGATGTQSFFKVVLPNIKTGLLGAVLLSFITSFNNVPVSLFLSGPNVTTLPIQMMIYGEYYFDPSIAALSVIVLLMTMMLVYLMERTIGLAYFTSSR